MSGDPFDLTGLVPCPECGGRLSVPCEACGGRGRRRGGRSAARLVRVQSGEALLHAVREQM